MHPPDGRPRCRHGLPLVLAQEGIAAGCEAAGAEKAIDLAGRVPPIALMDLTIGNGLESLTDLNARNIPALVCSMHAEPGYVEGTKAARGRGYITKTDAAEQLAHAVRDVLARFGPLLRYNRKQSTETRHRGLSQSVRIPQGGAYAPGIAFGVTQSSH